MKNLTLLWMISIVFILTWCGNNYNFMDVDNPNAKNDIKNVIWSWKIPRINADDIIPDSLSWKRNDAKWYANKYYEDTLEEYVDIAKDWLSWAKESLKWYYNSWVDQLNWIITDSVSWMISWELNKIKVK